MSGLDREKARRLLQLRFGQAFVDDVLDALAGCVTDDPPTIDRDALINFISWERIAEARTRYSRSDEWWADRVLALLRPDPRIAQIEALLERPDTSHPHLVTVEGVRRILRGES